MKPRTYSFSGYGVEIVAKGNPVPTTNLASYSPNAVGLFTRWADAQTFRRGLAEHGLRVRVVRVSASIRAHSRPVRLRALRSPKS